MLGVPQFVDTTTGSWPRSEISSNSTCLTQVALSYYHGSNFSYYSGVAMNFSGERSGHLKAIMRPAGGPLAAACRIVPKVEILKRIKVLEKESILIRNFNILRARKYPFLENYKI